MIADRVERVFLDIVFTGQITILAVQNELAANPIDLVVAMTDECFIVGIEDLEVGGSEVERLDGLGGGRSRQHQQNSDPYRENSRLPPMRRFGSFGRVVTFPNRHEAIQPDFRSRASRERWKCGKIFFRHWDRGPIPVDAALA